MDFINSQWFWYTLGIVLLIFEMIVPGTLLPGLFFLSAIVTGVASNFIDNVYILGIIFAVLSIVLVLFAKPFLEKKFKINEEVRPSTIDKLVGEKGIVISLHDGKNKARGTFNNEEWALDSEDELKLNDKIEIIKIEGVTATVKVIKK